MRSHRVFDNSYEHKMGRSRLERIFVLRGSVFHFGGFFGMLAVRIWNTFPPIN